MEKKAEVIFCDWKETSESFIEQLKKTLAKFNLSVIDHPDAKGTDMYGLIISSAPLTQEEIDEYDSRKQRAKEEE